MYYNDNIDNVSVIKRMSRMQSDLFDDDDEFNEFDAEENLIQQVIKFYTSTLNSSSRAKKYLSRRGLRSADIIDHFQLGFANRSLGYKFKKMDRRQKEISRGALQRIGLLKPSGHEFFRGSLVFPFVDRDNRVTGAYGRRITARLKAPSVYHVHWISDRTTFFNENILKTEKDIVLCKSPLEALTLWRVGIRNVVSLMGMRSFNNNHLKCLIDERVHCVRIAFDNNRQGNFCCSELAKLLVSHGISCLGVRLPERMDVNHFACTVKQPQQALKRLVETAPPYRFRKYG